jgi:hypothetical protein
MLRNFPTIFISAAMFIAASSASAATLVVDNTQDFNGVFLRACTAAPNDCSFWGAITAANLTAEHDTIAFNIPVADDPGCTLATQVCRVRTPSSIVNVLHPVTIDGYTQPGASANTLSGANSGVNMVIKIELVRSQAGQATQNRLYFQSSTTIRGIAAVVDAFSLQSGMFVFYPFQPTQDVIIEGNILGAFANGETSAQSTQATFVQIDDCGMMVGATNPASTVRIGGALPAQRNWLLAGNPALKIAGCALATGSFSASVQGNLFGTTKDGLAAINNGVNAVDWINIVTRGDPTLLIGGTQPEQRNVFVRTINSVISSNLAVGPAAPTTRIFGNYFGMGVDGQTPLVLPFTANGFSRDILNVRRAKIGGTAPGEGNLFVGNQVITVIDTPVNTSVRGNTFVANQAFRIITRALNGEINHPARPAITSFATDTPTAGSVRLNYSIASTAAQTTYPLTVEFYKAGIGNNPSQFIGRDSYLAAEAGSAKQIDFVVPAGITVAQNDVIIASSSADNDQGTSEFSRYISRIDFIGNEPAYVNVANVYRVRMQALGPFRPRGTVSIVAGLSGGVFQYRCTATLVPSPAGPFIADGSCPLFLPGFAGSTIAIGALYDSDFDNFRNENDGQPSAGRNVTLLAPLTDDIFKNGFEGN